MGERWIVVMLPARCVTVPSSLVLFSWVSLFAQSCAGISMCSLHRFGDKLQICVGSAYLHSCGFSFTWVFNVQISAILVTGENTFEVTLLDVLLRML